MIIILCYLRVYLFSFSDTIAYSVMLVAGDFFSIQAFRIKLFLVLFFKQQQKIIFLLPVESAGVTGIFLAATGIFFFCGNFRTKSKKNFSGITILFQNKKKIQNRNFFSTGCLPDFFFSSPEQKIFVAFTVDWGCWCSGMESGGEQLQFPVVTSVPASAAGGGDEARRCRLPAGWRDAGGTAAGSRTSASLLLLPPPCCAVFPFR